MKKCTWCGKEYPDTAEACVVDGQALSGGEIAVTEPVRRDRRVEGIPGPASRLKLVEAGSDWRPQLLDLNRFENAFVFEEGFSRPDWKVIRAAIQQSASPETQPDAWAEAAIQWVQRVRADLGGDYSIRCSREFILLSAQEAVAAEKLLAFAEQTLARIYESLGDAAWRTGQGKHVILLFTEDDDYYQYVSYFYRDGVHPTSGGCLIHKDYVHIAIPCLDGRHIRRTLAHELLHNSVVHLRLPAWLNEGLAVTFERTAGGVHRPVVDHELRERHLVFWNADNIQKFWSGVSFHEPGDSNELSYSLGEIMVNLLLERPKEFVSFVKEANWDDAGQTAALEVLGSDLGETMATFLGEGQWRPNRKAMVECWKAGAAKEGAARKERKEEGGEPANSGLTPVFGKSGLFA